MATEWTTLGLSTRLATDLENIDEAGIQKVKDIANEEHYTKEQIDIKIDNIQALPTGGTEGQVLTKASSVEGDAEWRDITGDEVFIGKVEEAPEGAKIIIEDEWTEEAYDEFPIGTIVDYNGDTVPDGYREVEDKGEIYSEEEKVIGTWLGKPIYRKVIRGRINDNLNNRIITSTNDYDKIIGYKGYFYTSTVCTPFMGTEYSEDTNNNSACRILILNNNLRLDAKASVWKTNDYEIAVEYTKTTD